MTKITKVYTQQESKAGFSAWKDVQTWIDKYAPGPASRVVLLVDSEYNDEGYDNKIRAAVFFDSNDNELLLNNSIEAISALPTYLPDQYSSTDEEVSNLTIEFTK